jgi:hypothetical protein
LERIKSVFSINDGIKVVLDAQLQPKPRLNYQQWEVSSKQCGMQGSMQNVEFKVQGSKFNAECKVQGSRFKVQF